MELSTHQISSTSSLTGGEALLLWILVSQCMSTEIQSQLVCSCQSLCIHYIDHSTKFGIDCNTCLQREPIEFPSSRGPQQLPPQGHQSAATDRSTSAR
jgi:hypothetical protein